MNTKTNGQVYLCTLKEKFRLSCLLQKLILLQEVAVLHGKINGICVALPLRKFKDHQVKEIIRRGVEM